MIQLIQDKIYFSHWRKYFSVMGSEPRTIICDFSLLFVEIRFFHISLFFIKKPLGRICQKWKKFNTSGPDVSKEYSKIRIIKGQVSMESKFWKRIQNYQNHSNLIVSGI